MVIGRNQGRVDNGVLDVIMEWNTFDEDDEVDDDADVAIPMLPSDLGALKSILEEWFAETVSPADRIKVKFYFIFFSFSFYIFFLLILDASCLYKWPMLAERWAPPKKIRSQAWKYKEQWQIQLQRLHISTRQPHQHQKQSKRSWKPCWVALL